MPSGKRVSPEFWRKHIAGWRASGLSQRAYCRRAGLSYYSFRTALQRERAASGDSGGQTGGDVSGFDKAAGAEAESPFVPVAVAGAAAESPPSGRQDIEIATASVTVRLPAATDGPRLAQAIAALQGGQ